MTKVTNWGAYPVVEAEVFETSDREELRQILKNQDHMIARGNGRCYGDASLQNKIFSTRQMNKIISFDRDAGILEAESGILLSEILQTIVPSGFFLPVLPGTKHVTLGGAIAADVHGKNHTQSGSFSNHVLSFEMLKEDGTISSCSPLKNSQLFWNTVGGMGLTGIILAASIRLQQIETSYFIQHSEKVTGLQDLLENFEKNAKDGYAVAWLDMSKKEDKPLRSVFSFGQHAPINTLTPDQILKPLISHHKKSWNIPNGLPGFMLNSWTSRMFNSFYYQYASRKNKNKPVHFDSFFFPLDALGNWNKLYGKKGMIQYQFVLPQEHCTAGLPQLIREVIRSGETCFLAVLKKMGPANPNAIMSFPMEGYTLALDFKVTKGVFNLLDKLDDLVLKYNGRLYLAKDARMSASFFSKSQVKKVPENTYFRSLQSDRLK